MVFKAGYWKVIVPLDPIKGRRYVELAKGKEIDNLYNVTMRMDDYVNSTIDVAISKRSISLCTSDSEEAL
jgi:hypothetical protein